ncbi:hypothetical protein EUX98_g3327 [Antrodiella citrinella]|uniref:Uncharacterized protein n=1 Tax=Antrodiella citrinella TaxID=2447956 RepID=A0A4S4MWW3_9APHY|nr:hypothetical protein EUX98_g3327 [Antrodiella citrinella]
MSQESPQAGPSSQQQQPQRTPLVFNRLPSIKIVRQPGGPYASSVDERCFTYCSQTVHGRISQAEPYCRTFCFRKVFNHEVKRALAVVEKDPETQQRNINTVEVDVQHPLPLEGQQAARFFSSLFGSPSKSSTPSELEDWHSMTGPTKPVDEVKYWKEGWYLWMSQSRWAAQEKMDLMMCGLEKQSEWQSHKAKVLEEWTAYESGQLQAGGLIGVGDSALEDHGHGLHPIPTAPTTPPEHGHDPPVPARPFPDHASQSLLIELPPPLPPLDRSVQAFFAPSLRLLDTTRHSIESGHQKQFASLVWEKAQTPEPYELMLKAVKRTWKFWSEHWTAQGPPDGKDKKEGS